VYGARSRISRSIQEHPPLDFPMTSADHRAILRRNAVRATASVMDCRRQRPTVVLTRRLSGDKLRRLRAALWISITRVLLTDPSYFAPDLRLPESGRNQNTAHALLFSQLPRRPFQLLAPLSLRNFINVFFQGQVNVTLPQFIHQMNPPLEFLLITNRLRHFA